MWYHKVVPSTQALHGSITFQKTIIGPWTIIVDGHATVRDLIGFRFRVSVYYLAVVHGSVTVLLEIFPVSGEQRAIGIFLSMLGPFQEQQKVW